MKKNINKILIILILITVLSFSVFNTYVRATSKLSLSVPSSVNLNSTFEVKFNMSSDAFSVQANITVTFSDGTTQSGRIVYLQGMESSFPNSIKFKASKAGKVTVKATEIVIADAAANASETNGSTETTLNVVDPNASSSTNTGTSQKPSTPSKPSKPSTTPSTNPTTNTAGSSTSTSVTFSDVNETVYLTTRCNIRSSYSTTSTKITTLNAGTALNRTGIGSNGWSRISYNGSTGYVLSEYVTKINPNSTTTTDEVVFTDIKSTMYAKASCNVRESYSTSSAKVGYLNKGQKIELTGTSTNGWSRIKYNNKTAYVSSSLLSKDEVKVEDNTTNEVTNSVVNDIENSANQVTENQLNEIKNKVGVLPEVGFNIANNLQIVAVVISILSCMLLIIYIKKNDL